MGCTASSSFRNNRSWRNSVHNSVIPISNQLTSDSWADAHFYESYISPPPQLLPLGEPPPYTENPEDGHISLMHGPSKTNDSLTTTHGLPNDSVDSQLNSTRILDSEFEHEQDSRAVTSSMDDSFEPVRTSSPLPISPLFPERPRRSRSFDSASINSSAVHFPPRPSLPQTHSSLYGGGIQPTITSFPVHLPPLEHRPSFPSAEQYLDRPPLLRYQLPHSPSPLHWNEELSERLQPQPSHPMEQNEERGSSPWDQECPLSQSIDNRQRQSESRQSRKRRRRKRVRTWHGERVAPAAHEQQDALINECIT